jgi:enoyl-CoA hydratase/carnithine racemase
MSYRTLLVERSGQVARIVLNRPEVLNAINRQMADDIDAALTELEGDDEVRVIVVTGAGRAFSAGRDAKEIGAPSHRSAADLWDRFEQLDKPVIGAINGLCYTGALSMVLAFDLIVASESAVFADTHARFGMLHGGGATQRLRALVGPLRAREIIFSSVPIDAAEAGRIGLVNRVVAAADLDQAVMDLAQRIAANDPAAVRAAKRAINDGLRWGTATGMQLEARAYRQQRRRVAQGEARIEVQLPARDTEVTR